MAKTLGSWSGMRKYLESEMLAPALAGIAVSIVMILRVQNKYNGGLF